MKNGWFTLSYKLAFEADRMGESTIIFEIVEIYF
jgi:hypothetical protein